MILANAFCLFFFLGEYLRAARAAGPREPGGLAGGALGACEQPGMRGRAGRRGDWRGDRRESAPPSELARRCPPSRAVWLRAGIKKET